MTPSEKISLGAYLASRLRKAAANLDPDLADLLEKRRAPVYLCVRSNGKRMVEIWLEEDNQRSCLEEGLTGVAELLGEHVAAATTVEVCLTHDFEVVNSANDQEWRAANFGATRGVLGVEFAYQGATERVSPITMIATNRDFERLLQLFAEKHSIPAERARGAVRVTRFAADQLLVMLDGEPRTVPLVRGARLVAPEEVTQEQTRALADDLGGFLARQVHDDGRMTYLYYPSRAGEEGDPTINNMIRQWMATFALCRFARAKQDERLMELADKNIRYNLEHYYRRRAGLGLIEFRGHIKLGAVALAVLSLMEHSKRQEYAEFEASLWRTIEHQWQQTGELRTFILPSDRNDQTNFYPGEALLAWAHRLRETNDPALLERFMLSFRHYKRWHLHPEHRNPAFIPWHTQAYYIVYQLTQAAGLAEFILEMNDWLVPVQQWPTPAHREFAGRFHDPDRPFGPPHASSTGVYMEGLIDAFELARTLGDERRRERYRRTISRGIRSLMQLAFRDEGDLFYSIDAGRLKGGVRTTCYNNVIRIDNVQHNLLALLKILPAFEEGDYSTASSEAAAAEK